MKEEEYKEFKSICACTCTWPSLLIVFCYHAGWLSFSFKLFRRCWTFSNLSGLECLQVGFEPLCRLRTCLMGKLQSLECHPFGFTPQFWYVLSCWGPSSCWLSSSIFYCIVKRWISWNRPYLQSFYGCFC